MNRSRVYIADDCIVSSLGIGTEDNVTAIGAGCSGVAPVSSFIGDSEKMCGLVSEEVTGRLRAEYGDSWTRTELFAVAVLDRLSGGYGKDETVRRAFVLSTTKGNIDLIGDTCGQVPEDAYLWKMAERIGNFAGFQGDDIYVISNACISGVSAIVAGKRLIESGKYDEVAVVGVDTLSDFIVSGFDSFRSLSPGLCRPYDASRCGLNLGEAAGAVLLSSKPSSGAVTVSGGSISDDANHISGPSRTGDALFFAMRDAMEDAGVSGTEISFINLHGTATVYNDEMESKAVALAGLSDVPAQSLKPYIGHTLGASGVVETILSACQLKGGCLFGTPGFVTAGTPMPVNASAETRKLEMRHCLKTASGLGGCNAAVVLSLDEYAADMPSWKPAETRTLRHIVMNNALAEEAGDCGGFDIFIREKYRESGLNDMKFYKMDSLSKLGYIASHLLLDGLEYGPEDMAVVLQNRSASLDSDLRHQRNISSGPGVSPSVFVYTLPNVASGEISIRHRIKGENTFFIAGEYERGKIMDYASLVLARSKAKYCIAGWLEFLGGDYSVEMDLIEKSDL